MEKVTLNGVEQISEQEAATMRALINAHSKDVHYLAFADKFKAYSSFSCWITRNIAVMSREREIIDDLLEKKELYSVFPDEKLSLYPIEIFSDFSYHADLSNNDKNFERILELNDGVYKTKYLFVDFVDLIEINKQDFELIIFSLQDLLKRSKKLKSIYIREMPQLV